MARVDWSFPRQVAIALAVLSGAGIYPLLAYAPAETVESALAGALLATLNVLLGYAAIEYAFGKSTATFFKYVLGGMGIRMLVLAVLLVILIRVFGFDAAALVGSMGIFYVVFLTLELLFIQKKIGVKHQG